MTFANSKVYKLFLVAVMAALLAGVWQVQRQLNFDRERLGLTRITPLENAPPVLAFTTVALGGFRGLIANALWIRANDLQEQDKFFEMFQLADWITKLEPHFVHVWLVQAWNMAYNISVKFPNPADRWRWVKGGIELLRDDGLRYNPGETLIYRELAWFFQHKMGQNLDDAHMFYKEAWYHEMQALLGGRPNYDQLLNPKTDEEKGRAKLLREKYKMDPAVMKRVDERYGPLEWRLPEAHAIYWAFLGLQKAKREDLITLRRVIYQSMQMAFSRGALIENKLNDTFVMGPNLDIIPNANKSYEEMIEQDAEMRDNIKTAHKNFLKSAPYFLYTYNRHREAAQWFKYLKEKYPAAVPPQQTLDEYTLDQVTEDAGDTNHDKTTALIGGLLGSAYLELLQDEEDRAVNYERLAQKVWKRYQGKISGQEKRIGLDPFPEMKQRVLDELLDPEKGLKPELAARLRTKLRLPAPTNALPAAAKPPK